ncbi:MAG TPA: hypothetical protein VHE55_10165 [Fimbriimonadaceae bacterium]|nr:hypothetical protein [Fimbriimonadaceae bacterium]
MAEEDDIDAKQADLLRRISDLQEAYQEAEATRGSARAPIELLYAMDYVLERAVRTALTELGASVEEPTDPSKEDGWFVVTLGDVQLKAVLEIKSTVNPQFRVTGIRQLGEWVQRGIHQRGVQYKPIFIGGSSVREPVANRPNPFVHDVITTAQQFEAALLRADDLFEVLMMHRLGQLNHEAFWRQLFSSVGPVDIGQVRVS